MGAYAVEVCHAASACNLILSVNTILYAARNPFMNETDPCGQFAWLNTQLKDAASTGQG